MKNGQAAHISGYLPVRRLRRLASRALAASVLLAMFPGSLGAAIDPNGDAPDRLMTRLWTSAQATPPPADAVVPPVRREQPPAATPAAEAPAASPAAKSTDPAAPANAAEAATPLVAKPDATAPESAGILGTIQEWLARANREYQGVIVKELSLPPTSAPTAGTQGEDEIAKKLEEQQAEDARKAAEAKKAADDASKAAAAKDKADESKKRAEDRKKAEDTKRLADEAKKKADELLKADTPAPAKSEDIERQRLEAQKLAEESKRQEAQRKADEARRAEALRIAEERRKAAATAAESKHRSRTIVLTPEPLPAPIARPVDPGTTFRPELSRGTRVADAGYERSENSGTERRRIRIFHEPTYRGITAVANRPVRGTAVKRWVWRSNGGACRGSGRSVTPPGRYTIKRGDSLWRISERHYHKGRLYSKIYSANRRAIRDPDLIYPCQRVLVPR